MSSHEQSARPASDAAADERPLLVPRRGVARWLVIGALFVAAFGVRLHRIGDPALDFHPMRQYRSALIARAYYFETLDAVPEWRREVAEINREQLGVWEPPVMEHVAFWAYRLAGRECLAVPRAVSALFWVVGGVFVLLLARRMVSPEAAFVSAAVYLFLPFGIRASRAFMPEPLMIMMMLASVYAVFRYWERPSLGRLLVAGVVSAAAIMVKSITVLAILGAFAGAGIAAHGVRRFVLNPRHLLFVAISIVPAAVYYGYGVFVSRTLTWMAQGKILPHLLLRPFFYSGWFAVVGQVVGYAVFIGALVGVLLCRRTLGRGLLIGLWAGFMLFVLVFSYTTHTHDYWSLQMLPIVALSLGPMVELVMDRLRELAARRLVRLAAAGVFVLGLVIGAGVALWPLRHMDLVGEARTMLEIGDAVEHSTRTLALAPDYGAPLWYHGELCGWAWPPRAYLRARELRGERMLSTEAWFKDLTDRHEPDYFVVTDFDEYRAQPELEALLTARYPVLAETDTYLIFDLRPGAQAK